MSIPMAAFIYCANVGNTMTITIQDGRLYDPKIRANVFPTKISVEEAYTRVLKYTKEHFGEENIVKADENAHIIIKKGPKMDVNRTSFLLRLCELSRAVALDEKIHSWDKKSDS